MNKKYKLFQPTNSAMFRIMLRSEILQWRLNHTPIWNIRKRNRLLKKLVARLDGKPYVVYSPLHMQQGNHTYIGKNFMCNFNCTIQDYADVYIGDDVFFGPNVSIVTVTHPMYPQERIVRIFSDSFEPRKRGNYEMVAPVKIGNKVWLATGVIVCPGAEIGDGAVIGAGSVVTKDIPPNVFACGNPCRVVRKITEEDRIAGIFI